MGDLRRSFRHQVPAFVEAGFRIATMDLRGHGDSDTTFTEYDDRAAASDVLALVEHLGGPAVLIGNSMGAGAVTLAAARQPAAVRGLLLIGPFVRNAPIPLVKRLGFRLAMAGPWASRVWLSYLPTMYPGRRDEDFAEHRRAIQESLHRPGRRRALTATTRTSHAPVAALVADRLRGRWVGIDDAGHYPHAEFPERTTPLLLDFTREVTAVPRTQDGA
jgi:pimeloyl-ACP methyl ester carboxylesterase